VELLVVAVLALTAGVIIGRFVLTRGPVEPAAAESAPVPVAAAPSRHADDAFTAVLEGLTTGVVLSDRAGSITFRNGAARVLAGTHAGVLIDHAVERHLRRALAGQETEELLELYGPPKMVVSIRAVPTTAGTAYAFVEDISERRRLDAVRTDFVANISHELKTPVGAIAVLAETLVDETDADIVRRIAERLVDESHRAARTIDDLLELSRIELGSERVSTNVSAAEVVRQAVLRTEALAERCGIVVEAPPPDTDHHVMGDQRQLVSAVGNLVENAVKYSESGGRVTVRTRHSGPWAEFEVSDQGVGIPPRDLDRIFERFYRVDRARSRGTGGTGLGLAIVRHVATNHGGEVVVSSREGEGSTFVLRVPTTGAERPAPPRGAS
jgi:two-component system sensor histidine kinase SenX3